MDDTGEESISILHVDDAPEFADLTATFLERENDRFSVETATSVPEALERIDASLPDCIVSDYDMPGQNGIEFLERVRQDHPALPFVLYTGKGSEEVASEAVSAGVSDYLQKDTGSEQYKLLAKRIENAVAQYRAQSELRGRRRQLEQLHGATRELMAATTRAEIAERASATAREILDLPLNGIHFYDPERNGLVPVAVTSDVYETIGDPPVIEPGEAVAWVAYETGEPQVYDDVRDAPAVMDTETDLRSEFHIPLGDHGVLVAGSTEPGDFTDADVTSAKILASNVESALDRAEREQELERTNALLSTLFDTLPQGVLATDGSGDVVAVNQQMLDFLDHPDMGEATIGTDGRRLLSEASRLFVDPEQFVERIDQQTSSREPVDNEELALEDGRTIEWSYRPVERPDGDGHLWVYDDVTDRTEYRNRVQELQYRTRRLIAARDESEIASTAVEIAEETLGFPLSGVHLVDEDEETLEPVAVTQEAQNHLDQEPVYDRKTPVRSVDSFNWRVFERGEPAIIENVREHEELSAAETPTRSGIVYPLGDHGLFITSSPVPNDFGENDVNLVEILATLVTALLDRVQRETELREQKQALQRKTDRLDEFASVVSHDIRTPLTVASGSLELVREEHDSEAAERVARALDRIDTLLGDLRRLAQEGEAVTELEPVALGSVVEDCWLNVETAEATLVAEVDRSVRADRSRLKELLENLYRNSITHGREDVTVTVGELENGFYVADDGPGIPAAEREAVFESGYSTSTNGMGFGLSIVAEIVEAHGWRIEVTESATGGARFEITGVELLET